MDFGSVKTFAKRLAPVVIVAIPVAVWVGRAAIVDSVLRFAVLPALQAQVPGLSVRFEGVSANLVSRLEFNRLTAEYCRDGACLKATIPAVRLTYPLAGIFPWPGLASAVPQVAVELHAPVISGRIPSRQGSASAETPWQLPALPMLPAIAATDCSVDLTVAGGAVSGRGIDLSAPQHLPGDQAPYPLTVNGQRLTVSLDGLPRQEGAVALTLLYRPGRLEAPEVTFADRILLKEAELATDANGVRFVSELHLLQSSGLIQGGVAGRRGTLSFHIAQGDIGALAGAAGVVAPAMSGEMQAEGELTMTLGRRETLAGEVKAAVKGGVWDGAAIDRFEIVARAAEEHLRIDSLTVDVGDNHLAVRDGVTPIPGATMKPWREIVAASTAKVELRLAGIDELPSAWTAPLREHWQALGLEQGSATAILADGTLTIAQAEVSGEAGTAKVKKGQLDLSRQVDDWLAVPWSIEWQADLNDAAVIRYFWEDWPATGGKAKGQGRFSGTLADPHLPFTAAFTGSSVYGVPVAQVSGRLEWTKDRLALDAEAINQEHDRLKWQGAIDLDRGGLIKTRIETAIGGLHHYFPNDLFPDFAASGTFTGTAILDGEFSRLEGEIKASGDWVVNGVTVSEAKTDLALTGEAWTFRQAVARINDAVSADAAGRMIPNAGWDRFKLNFDRLRLASMGEELTLEQPGGISVSGDRIAVGSPLTFAGTAGAFRLSGALGGKEQLVVVGEGVRDTGLVHRLWGKEIGFADLDFTLGLSGSPARPEWRWHGTIRGLAAAGAPLALSGRFDVAADQAGLWIRQCELGDDGQTVVLSGHLPMSIRGDGVALLPQPLSLKGHILLPEAGILPRLFPEWLGESGQVRAELSLAGTWDHPRGAIQLDADGVKPGSRWQAMPPGPFSVHGEIAIADDRLTIAGFTLSSPGFSVQAAGSVTELSLAGLIDGRQGGREQGQLALSGRYGMDDLGWLAARIPGLRRTGGSAKGSFAVEGTLSHPEVRADLAVTKGEARGGDSLLAARDISLMAALAQDRLTIASLSGALGGAAVRGEGKIAGITTPEPELDIHMTGKDLLLYRSDGVKVRADTDLSLGGTIKMPELSGEVLLTDSRVTKKVNWLSLLKPGTRHAGLGSVTLFSFPDPPLKDTKFNVRVKAARPMVITNNVYKGGVRPDLTLAGTGELPFLTGVIYADSGLITLPSGRLDMERGVLRFTDVSPERPTVEGQASGRMMGYDVTAQVSGPYDEPEVTLSSSPSLSNEDLLMLLLTGRQPVNSGTANNDVSSVAVYFGRGLLSRLLGEEEDDSLLLERLEVDVGRAVSLQGEPTVDARFKLADTAWQKDTAIYLTGEKDVWDYYNAGLRVVFRFQ